ncbi:MAG: DUF1538 domain-containing protein [Spirochaetia bacterium]|nr:DUF1538 domain-containing protein [Spirochaetia bacterium]
MEAIKNTLPKIKMTWKERLTILKPYLGDRIYEQIKNVWLIITYLILFQLIILRLPIVDSIMIAVGIAIVLFGLMLFMEGLTLGLMPFGETIGATLPQKAGLIIILSFAFMLGLGATFAEPAIATLQLAGRYIEPDSAPLLYSLLNEFAGQLVIAVGVGVGIAVIFGVLRFLYSWSLKVLIYPLVILLTFFTVFANFNEALNPVIGLAWDCGAVTTGPVTVPLVLALGIGVSRIVSGSSGGTGFGIVTLASLFPIIAVFSLAFGHLGLDDYYGRPNSKLKFDKQAASAHVALSEEKNKPKELAETGYSFEDFEKFRKSGKVPAGSELSFKGDMKLDEGKIIIDNASIIVKKRYGFRAKMSDLRFWDDALDFFEKLKDSLIGAARAILPLCLLLFLVLRGILREKIKGSDEIAIGIFFALIGMSLFMLGIFLALEPLGSQVGQNISSSFTAIKPYGALGMHGPLFENKFIGQIAVILFGFALGYSATLAEPALNALGATVEKITIGSFRKSLLMQSVAAGVGIGIAAGVAKLVFDLPLSWMLLPPYMILLVLTFISSEDFVNFAWDSAGVTTGPITVPLVLAMGLGIGQSIGALEGFGVLAMASVFPILTVLIVGKLVQQSESSETEEEVEA